MKVQTDKFERALESIRRLIGGKFTKYIGSPSLGKREKFLHQVLSILHKAEACKISNQQAVDKIRQLCSRLGYYAYKSQPGHPDNDDLHWDWMCMRVKWVILSVEQQTMDGIHIDLFQNPNQSLQKLADSLLNGNEFLKLESGQRLILINASTEADRIAAMMELGQALREGRSDPEQVRVELNGSANVLATQAPGYYPRATLDKNGWDQFDGLWLGTSCVFEDVNVQYLIEEAHSAAYPEGATLVLKRNCVGQRIEIPIVIVPKP